VANNLAVAGRRNKLRGNALNNDRLMRHKSGLTIEAIAREDGVSESTVKQSIETAHAYRALLTQTEVELSQNDVIVSTVEIQKKQLAGALEATKLVKKGNRYVEVPDWEVRMRALELIPDLVTAAKPKVQTGHLTQVNVQQVANAAAEKQAQTASGKGIESFEDMLRRINSQKKLESGEAPPSDVIDAEVIDASPPGR
jgi:predicted transcriptional regulator